MSVSKSLPSVFSTYGIKQQNNARVFAFPYSGAGTSIYHQWVNSFQQYGIDFIGVQRAGRENLFSEPAVADLELLLEQLLPSIKPLLHQPFILFGHSLGGLIAFELCRLLHKHHLPLPQALVVSAHQAPTHQREHPVLHHLPQAEFIQGLRRYHGTAEEVLDNEELMEILLPMLRADFSLSETYHYQASEPLPCPIVTLMGEDDEISRPEWMHAWEQQTQSNYQAYLYSGKHFFIQEYKEDIINKLQQLLFKY